MAPTETDETKKPEVKETEVKNHYSYKLPLPKLDECVSYDHYKNELECWKEFSGVESEKQAGLIAFSLPSNHKTRVREKVFQNFGVAKMKQKSGVEDLLIFMNAILGKDSLLDAWEKFDKFECLRREDDQEMSSFINDFDIAHSQLEKLALSIPASILAFKLLKNANISDQSRFLVLSGMNLEKKDELYESAKTNLKKFSDNSTKKEERKHAEDGAFKFKLDEPASTLYTSGNRNGNFYNSYRRNQMSSERGARGGRPPQRPGFQPRGGRGTETYRGPRLNKFGWDGKRLTCHICKSIEHLSYDCQQNIENRQQVRLTEVEEARNLHSEGQEIVMSSVIVLAENVGRLGEQSYGCAILDTACSSSVAGRNWMNNYTESLSDSAGQTVTVKPSQRKFRFGGGEILGSSGEYTIPATLAGKSVKIKVDVVDSDIPLLLSKSAMKTAQIKLDLVGDIAEIFGMKIKLNVTPSGHYFVKIGDKNEKGSDEIGEMICIQEVCAVDLASLPLEKMKSAIAKIHRQFAHPSQDRLKLLLKECGSWRETFVPVIEQIYSDCEICKMYTKTRPRPSVAAPMAYNFNEKVAMDLKKWGNKWILHMIDMWSRFTISIFINRKRPQEVIDCILKYWIGAGYGVMSTILTDNGGEFNSEETREVASILNIEILTTAAESPFQNGLCERNHSVVDSMLLKLVEQCPKTPENVLLAWAVNAKNCLQMSNGFSSYQLVFGRNPKIPNVTTDQLPALDGKTTSETLAQHLNALHASRLAYIESETSERVRRALRTRVRTSEEQFENGERVFYQRENSKRWLGPARVVFQDGKVIFVRHGGVLVKVSPTRLVKANNSFSGEAKESEKKIVDSRGAAFENDRIARDNDRDMDLYIRCFSRSKTDNESDAATGESIRPPEPERDQEPERAAEPAPEPEPIPERRVRPEPMEEPVVRAEPDPPPQNRQTTRTTIRHDYAKLHKVGRQNDVYANFTPRSNEDNDACEAAKLGEIENWKRYKVYEEVEDRGQYVISTRWVLTEKYNDDGTKKIKARLVARGFEEETKTQSDSPTANKETIRTFLALSSSLEWKCNSIDIRAAFLQGKSIDREVYLRPPKDLARPGSVWKLKRTVYGLTDASRSWYLNVRETLIALGCKQSKLDLALFTSHSSDKLSGIIVIHVDDFMWSGSPAFKEKVIDLMRKKFEIGKECHENFQYVGLDISQCSKGIMVSQDGYIQDVNPIVVAQSRAGQRNFAVSEEERKSLREIVGKLNWVTQQTRPDLGFDTLDLSMSINDAKVEDLIKANKAVRQLKSVDGVVTFPHLGRLENARLVVYSDASHANLRDGVSSAFGFVVFLVGENGESCPLVWKSAKIRRVVKSTLSAETMALVCAVDEALYLKHLLKEILGRNDLKLPITGVVDNRSLVENLHSTKSAQEKVLRIDLAALKEHLNRGEVESIRWVDSKGQLADCLTKRGVCSRSLRNAFASGVKSCLDNF